PPLRSLCGCGSVSDSAGCKVHLRGDHGARRNEPMNPIAASIAGCLLLLSLTAPAGALKYAIQPGLFEERPGNLPLGPCHGGAVIDKAGNIYVTTDTTRGNVVFSPERRFLRAVGPTRIHALEVREEAGTEYLYCARPADHEVVKLGLDGQQKWSLRHPEASGIYQNEEGFRPCAVTVAPDGAIF